MTLLDETPLEREIAERIRIEGSLPLPEYMAAVSFHPKYGRYAATAPVGASGDFTTSPEISQIFGEMIGLALVQAWADMGAPDPFHLIELGPGRGTLMADLLRAAALRPDFIKAARLELVEGSAPLRALQAEKLGGAPLPATWRRRYEDTPEGPTLLVANEFFDCLPIRQFERCGGAWRERCVVLDDHDRLTFGLRPEPTDLSKTLPEDVRAPREGDIFEFCPAAFAFGRVFGERAARFPAAALIIDYGHARTGYGDTLQAIHRHGIVDVLSRPGEADVSAYVDFEMLARAVALGGGRPWRPLTQGEWLNVVGARTRATALAAATPSAADNIEAGLRRLIGDDAMGALFLAMAATHRGATPPAGFS